jgi:beta-glucanase (GH16 family)
MALPLVRQQNALGTWLSVSGSPVNLVVAFGAGSTFAGTNQNDAFLSYGGGITLLGGLGDDVYYVWDNADIVTESAGQGIDTVVAYDWRTVLANNVENLVVASDGAIGIGNAQNNIVAGDEGSQSIDGGGGNDVLIGGAGADFFLFARGSGKDAIADFQTGLDIVSFNATLSQFTDIVTIRAAMTQVGADVALDLGASETITFRGHAIADFTAGDFRLAPNVGAMRQTFADEFSGFRSSASGLDAAGKPVWQTAYEFSPGFTIRTLAPGSPETQYYSDSSTGTNPFAANGTTLRITATPAITVLPEGMTYTSGVITTRTSFSQLYGYFEASAKLPAGEGFWPAFWMIRADGTWPPELDVLEASSSQTNLVTTSALSVAGNAYAEASAVHHIGDLSTAFHAYGVSWRPDMLRFYIDGREVFATPTPADMNSPMYMIASLAVGDDSAWPGPADGVSSGTFELDYIRAWQYRDLPPTIPTALTMRVPAGTTATDTLVGGATDDRLEGGKGNDTLTGGAGTDSFVFANQTGTDTVTDFQAGIDKIVIQGFGSAQITSQALAQGTQLSFGTNKVMLNGVWWLGPTDIVAGATVTTGTAGTDTLDRSSAITPEASITGAAGNDTIRGGAGDDWIIGGAGNDLMTGNGGKDSFYLMTGAGQDQITDFVPGLDRLILKGATQASLSANWTSVGGVEGMRLNYGAAGDSVFLAGLNNALRPDSIYLA